MTPIEDRISVLNTTPLTSGTHESLNAGACAMELVSYLAGEPWSDHPACVCPVLGAFLRNWNDSLPSDAERDRLLKPLLLEVIGTKSTAAVEERRSYLALDWLVRVYTPQWFDLVPALTPHAAALRDSAEIVDLASAIAARTLTTAAWAAAWGAAWDAAWAAARDAAWAAARDAAWDAAWGALQPTVNALQLSAVDLVRRMSRVAS